jgi:hypothetical protein
VRTFTGYVPPARYDGAPFTAARIEERASLTAGAWAQIDSIALVPVDADPSAPAARNLTTPNATLEAGYYRIVWLDAAAGTFAGDAVFFDGTSDTPAAPALATLDELKRRVHASGGGVVDETLLGELLDAASARIVELTGDRTLAPDPANPTDDAVSRTFPVYGAIVQVPDLRVVESITLDDRELTVAVDYTLRGRHAKPAWWVKLNNYRGDLFDTAGGGRTPELTVVGHWGPLAVEAHVRDLALTWASRAFHERQARFADATQDPAGGAASYFRTVPAQVQLVLSALRIPGL